MYVNLHDIGVPMNTEQYSILYSLFVDEYSFMLILVAASLQVSTVVPNGTYYAQR